MIFLVFIVIRLEKKSTKQKRVKTGVLENLLR